MKHFTIHPDAKKELFEATNYYDAQVSGLGDEFVKVIEQGIQLILLYPEIGQKHEYDTRRFTVQKFPFIIVYRNIQEAIEVIAFMHQKRKPNYWKSRLQ